MSYDIGIYSSNFLRDALSRGLGDWTGAPEIPEANRMEMVSALRANGFRSTPHHPGFLAFAVEQGLTLSEDFICDDSECLATASLFKSSLNFAIPISDRSSNSVAQCLRIGRQLIAGRALALYDPQAGELFG
ncbi:hypothetical protein J2W34_005156 [Variovorax boronicumulans]|uniref:hypothetical protein n=1 Tax=Variovorax boronicumulans TaxID=436515 RepID=UPI0027895A8A|nr:hypothetical protein [Variovorax boronicumulans]MDQ0073348.1 hypothetical protein [Variovorax boronicumulans]